MLAAITVMLLVLQIGFMLGERSENQVLGVADGLSSERMVELTNQERISAGAEPLARSERLDMAAAAKARDMVERGYWNHYGPDGTTPWSFIEDSGYRYRYAGENLAKNFQTSRGVLEGWMASQDHRDNLLLPEYEEIGIARASGTIDGRQTNVVVALYAAPAQQLGVTAGSSATAKGMVLPALQTYSVVRPLNILHTMPLPAQIASVVACLLAFVYVGQHLTIRRRHLLWDRHLHPRPMLQAAAMIVLVIALMNVSLGAVG